MAASARPFISPSPYRHLLCNHHAPFILRSKLASRSPNPRNFFGLSSIPRNYHRSVPFCSSSVPIRSPFSLSISQISSASDPGKGFHVWDTAAEPVNGNDLGFKGSSWTVVLLGWLGSEQKHLKRYAELYNSKGIRSVRFVVPVRGILGFDLGRRVEDKVEGFTRELVSWCSETENGKDHRLLFHTFSNTGWLIYGAILDNLQSRSDIIEKIKGCVVDSGADPEISPQVWAAGFCAALLKKRSSLTSSTVSTEGFKLNCSTINLNIPDIRPRLSEIIILAILEKFFTVFLMLPDVNRRLSKVISVLIKSQPSSPQLYLYSSADKVIPFQSIERFIKEQKALGKNVHTHNFGSSPHVDHFRSFPDVYSTKINEFLKECCTPACAQML